LYLIIIVIVLSAILALIGVSVTEQITVPVETADVELNYYADTTEPLSVYPSTPYDAEYDIRETTIAVRSLLSVEGLRFIFASFVANFAGFTVISVTLVAMAGVGVAEAAGLMAALIRQLVKVAPRRLIAFMIIFVGALSSIASDAGYLILIPLGAAAFLTLKRHPLAGMARFWRGGRHLCRQHPHHADRQHDYGDHK
jgi:aminobenzoyl-glutamate transport protein